ncbi:NAD(P)/FAD-dependent oxidoreductase [Allopusillimonas ginsengisoli]|uniref:NAD(P)/FAD-dependent oxidoreductase n=1 Tax=Allopusillimonas ginsengisoli TaxID=453575 RepID=UPI0010223CA9|nr:FAD-dependent oxidoreductase [Allopusillimonas ginsengisoli]TEA79015.1 FAD-dependent oxidoreductase [Allopusillimonas ginsengisoli]
MERVSIVGAGIVGICTAVALQQRGVAVRIIDERDPGTGASFGNAGLVSIDSCIPIAMPGMLRNVPKWLFDTQGPLSVRPGYLPYASPWLLKWIRSGASEKHVSLLCRALRRLHKDALVHYRNLLGARGFNEVIRLSGQLHVWDTPRKSAGDLLADRLRAEQGVVARDLSVEEITELMPGMARTVRRAQLYENNGYVATPYQLVQRLFQQFIDGGGEFLQQRVNGISPHSDGAGFRIITSCSDLRSSRVVICAGAWSKRLLKGLGIDIPLETERGYHVSFDSSALDLPMPVMHKEHAFGVTPMGESIRVAGFVEIAGLDAEPDMSREAALVAHAKRLFPALDTSRKDRFWLGFRPSTPDSLPILGGLDNMPGLFLGFGHGHTGITGAPVSAEILANLITGTANTIDVAPYAINRF